MPANTQPDTASPTGPVETMAEALLQVVGGSRIDAAHVASALQTHRGHLRSVGMGVPPVVERLEHVFARVAIPGSPGVTGGHSGSDVGQPLTGIDSVVREDATVALLTREQAARRLGCSVSTLKRRERAGSIQPQRHGRVLRYRPEDLDHYLERTPCR